MILVSTFPICIPERHSLVGQAVLCWALFARPTVGGILSPCEKGGYEIGSHLVAQPRNRDSTVTGCVTGSHARSPYKASHRRRDSICPPCFPLSNSLRVA